MLECAAKSNGKFGPSKLVVDLLRLSSIPVLMDEIDRELFQLLGTRIGMLMEDHATAALTVGYQPRDEQKAIIDALADASMKIVKLAEAARTISR